MQTKRRLVALACMFSASLLPGFVKADPASPIVPTNAEGWSQAAREDIAAAARITAENHPGYVDRANPGFKSLLAQAQRNGLALAGDVTDASGYVAALRRFSNTLQDGHAGAYPTLDNSLLPKPKWPGFVAVWRGDRAYVYNALPGGPVRGSQIVSCDGVSIRNLALRNVFAFRGRPSEPGNWWVEVRRVFIDTGNPFVSLPRVCTFRENGKSVRQTLDWRETDASFNQWRDDSYNGVTLPVGMTRRDSGIIWIAMPNFQPNETEQASYRSIVTQIEADPAHISAAKAIVLDLRDNQGGSSVWSRMIADALWGKERRNAAMAAYNRGSQAVRWRTSDGNARHVEALVPKFREQGLNSLAVAWTAIYQGMDAARARGEAFFTEANDIAPATAPTNQLAPQLTRQLAAPVYVIVPGQCASACLDAVDVFTRFADVKLIGAPSSADSTYMDIRSQALPSGLGAVIIPNKVYVSRPRGAGFAYRPSIEVRDIDWSSEAFENIALNDLSGGRVANRIR